MLLKLEHPRNVSMDNFQGQSLCWKYVPKSRKSPGLLMDQGARSDVH